MGITLAGVMLVATSLWAQGDLINDVARQLSQGDFSAAEAELRAYRGQMGATPVYLEALSWMARAAAANAQWDKASSYAKQTRTLAEQQLGRRKVDAEPHLPTALGAAYEVLALGLAEKGQQAQAVALLRSALARYGTTSIGPRLQKNLNLIALVGHSAPPLQVNDYLGPKPPTLSSLRGSPVLLFFWAHWCADCKAEAPIIAQLRQEFAPQGLVVIGPTQFYGYVARGADATPAQEKAYIDAVRQRYYGFLLDMPVPLSNQNFKTYGASTTPTLVVLNRAGRVEMYHPGAMGYDELRAAIQKVTIR